MTVLSNQEMRFLDEVTLNTLKNLIELMEKSSLSSMRFEQEFSGVRHFVELSKEFKLHTSVQSDPCVENSNSESLKHPASVSLDLEKKEDLHWVTSPLVGTTYVALKPGSEPLVKIGDHVVIGAPLLIVEAMKVMNLIKSPVSGYVREIRFSDGNPVEYGEELLGIDTKS
ncbi:biotin carboxyl carrier protein of acetyl-CoA carboxylase [Holospora obtusa F1]|uniref:Biotin carboxyl carrier protein of acetyl-CoA carboxylase n=1 Tax=Holospora obtusa F1 TaxID=1399147 RepID=W6THN7_HOLOB|nr:biotin/lipoyl-containing protein [Holospora obtusa]ETZ07450.1 biotin carboxyl carrier protein of acetyl-CoA carboxylase [Holospora obtusa F1]